MIGIAKIKTIAPVLQAMREDPHAKFFYDIFSSALVWTDEFPQIDDLDAISCLRCILRYRTSLILGHPEAQYEHYWSEAAELCPNWPGFLSDRKSSALATTYRELALKGDARLQAFFDQHPE
jgi:hypothetical protein